jgi:hypothetical protein
MPHETLRLVLTTAPAELPATLAEAKAQLNIEDARIEDDALITANLAAAVDAAETFTHRALITQTWTLFRDAWPRTPGPDGRLWEGARTGADLPQSDLSGSGAAAVELPKPPLQSLVHVKTYDDSDVAATVAAGNYFVDTASEPGRVVLRGSAAVPVVTRVANGLELRFVAGYGDNAADVPEDIRSGILRLAAFLTENRGDGPPGDAAEASGAARLWRPFRVSRL